MTEQPNYYAIIPADVRYDSRLTANAKLLYGEITSLSNKDGKCWATNKYFAELYGVSVVSISKWINQLIAYGYLESEIIYKEGTKEIFNRYLTLVKGGIKEKFKGGIKEKFKDNNTSMNNTRYNNITPISPKNFEGEISESSVEEKKEKEKKVAPKKEKEIPSQEDFVSYGMNLFYELGINAEEYLFSLKAKWEAWNDNEWRDGHNNQIKNWKSKLKNTLPHLKPFKQNGKTIATNQSREQRLEGVKELSRLADAILGTNS